MKSSQNVIRNKLLDFRNFLSVISPNWVSFNCSRKVTKRDKMNIKIYLSRYRVCKRWVLLSFCKSFKLVFDNICSWSCLSMTVEFDELLLPNTCISKGEIGLSVTGDLGDTCQTWMSVLLADESVRTSAMRDRRRVGDEMRRDISMLTFIELEHRRTQRLRSVALDGKFIALVVAVIVMINADSSRLVRLCWASCHEIVSSFVGFACPTNLVPLLWWYV